MASRRRVQVSRVHLAAGATLSAACLAVPAALTVLREDLEIARPAPPAGELSAPAVSRAPGPALEAPGAAGLAALATARASGDVVGLLDAVREGRNDRRPAARRRTVIAIASLAVVEDAAAEGALRAIVLDADAPSLERTTALAALWERGARAFVQEQGDVSTDDAVRCKARALVEARG